MPHTSFHSILSLIRPPGISPSLNLEWIWHKTHIRMLKIISFLITSSNLGVGFVYPTAVRGEGACGEDLAVWSLSPWWDQIETGSDREIWCVEQAGRVVSRPLSDSQSASPRLPVFVLYSPFLMFPLLPLIPIRIYFRGYHTALFTC